MGANLFSQASQSSLPILGGLAGLRDELREKFGLRLGLYLVFGFMWVYGILLLQDAVKAETTKVKLAQTQRLRAESIAKEGDWGARAIAAKESVTDAQALLWRAESVGLAQVLVGEQITKSLSRAAITPRILQVASGVESKPALMPAEIMPMRVKVQFEFKQNAFYAWLEQLARDREERRPSFVIESISVRGVPSPTVDVELVAYVLKAKPEAPVGAASNPALPSVK